jgi:hypothetical protein
MEKAAEAGRSTAGAHNEVRIGACAALVLCAASPAAWAEPPAQPPAQVLVAQAREPGVRVQVQTSNLPRMEAQDSAFQGPRVDVSLFPSRRLGFGLGPVLGVSGFTARQGQQPIGLPQHQPSIDFGLRWSQRVQSQQIDITAWRRMNTDDDAYTLVQSRQPVYGARLEMNLAAAARSPFALDRGFIGFQLESGARISLKRSNGRPMIYYRSTF